MIFLDTSFVVAMANSRDPNHHAAVATFARAVEDAERILTHNYVLSEAAAVLQRRLGVQSALDFLRQSRRFEVHWITTDDHEDAVALFEDRGRRALSLVDCASFVVMRRRGVTEALAFDADFEAEGFVLYRAAP